MNQVFERYKLKTLNSSISTKEIKSIIDILQKKKASDPGNLAGKFYQKKTDTKLYFF